MLWIEDTARKSQRIASLAYIAMSKASYMLKPKRITWTIILQRLECIGLSSAVHLTDDDFYLFNKRSIKFMQKAIFPTLRYK